VDGLIRAAPGAGGWLALLLALACTGSKTEEPVVSTAGGKTAVSEAGTSVARRGKSLVRLVNALPGDRTIDLSGDDRTVFFDVGYKTVTPYTEIGDNVVKFRLRPGGTDSVWADNTETLINGNRYTVVVLPTKEGGARIVVLTDEVVTDTGKARLRVVNAAVPYSEVDVGIEGRNDPVFDDVAYGSAAGFKEVDPASAVILVRQDEPPMTVLKMQRLRLDAGKSYTIIIAGDKAGALQAITVTDAIRSYASQ
jgi:hypothetical protein